MKYILIAICLVAGVFLYTTKGSCNIYDTEYMQEFVGKIYLHNLEMWRNVARGEIREVTDEYIELYHMPTSFNKKIGTTWECIDGKHSRDDFVYYKRT